MTVSVVEKLPPYVERVEVLLEGIDPNHLGKENWSRAVSAIFHRTGGSEAGFALALRWSKTLTDYPGDNYVASFWLFGALLAMRELGDDRFRALRAKYAREDASHRIAIADGTARNGVDA